MGTFWVWALGACLGAGGVVVRGVCSSPVISPGYESRFVLLNSLSGLAVS